MNNKVTVWRYITAVSLIKAFGVVFALAIFARYTPLVDSQLYVSGFYAGTGEIRTGLVQSLATLLTRVGGPCLAHYGFAMISTLGLIYYYLIGGRRAFLLLTLLLPSTLVWTSIVGKEAIFCGFLSIALVIWSSYAVRALRWYEILVVLGSLIICFAFRPHYAAALLWLFVSAFVVKNTRNWAPAILLMLLAIGFTLVYLFVWDELLFRGYSGIDSAARSSRFELFDIDPLSDRNHSGFLKFRSMIHVGMLVGIVGPLPSEVAQRIEFLPFFTEGFLVLCSPLLIFLYALKKGLFVQQYFNKLFFWCIAPSLIMLTLVHAPFGLLNPGSATRWRVNFEQFFYLAPLLLTFGFLDQKR